MDKKKRITIIFVVILILILAVFWGGDDSHEGEARTPSESSEMRGLDFETVEESFKANGFTNIKLEKIEDLITGWLTKDGEVEEVSVGGDAGYASGSWVSADTEVIIRYHTFPTESTASESLATESIATESIATESIATESIATESIAAESTQEVTPTQESLAIVEDAIEENDQADEILTADNCEELADILLNKDAPYESYVDFASKYEGRTIEFDGRIDYLVNHENYNTRYDILVSAGDYNPDTQIGPTFKFEDVGLWDLGLDYLSISVGMNVRIIAEVEEFNYDTGIFFLDPISVIER